MRLRDIATLVDTYVLGYEVKYKDDINAHVLPKKKIGERALIGMLPVSIARCQNFISDSRV